MSQIKFKAVLRSLDDIHVSLDLETASVSPTAAIVQIGAAAFIKGKLETFCSGVSLQSCEAARLTTDKETMEWWDKQDPELRKKVFGSNVNLAHALDQFTEWCWNISDHHLDRIHIWGNGCDFDNIILKNAYETFTSYPFDFRKHQHLRTLMYCTPEKVQEQAYKDFVRSFPNHSAHDALDDAVCQLFKITSALNYNYNYGNT